MRWLLPLRDFLFVLSIYPNTDFHILFTYGDRLGPFTCYTNYTNDLNTYLLHYKFTYYNLCLQYLAPFSNV
jgi:hypothetical protein